MFEDFHYVNKTAGWLRDIPSGYSPKFSPLAYSDRHVGTQAQAQVQM